jgi:RNA polymerase sigma-70 factor, ECF subfamily
MDTTVVSESYQAYHDQLHGYVMSITRAPEAAEDLVQESFGRLLREVQAGRTPAHPRAWLYQVARNLAVSRGRRMQVAERSIPRLRTGTSAASAEEQYLLREAGSELGALLAELSPDDRSALLMAAQGYSGAEIARATGRSENCVRTRICRARMRLRARLAAADGQRSTGDHATVVCAPV